MKKLLEEKIRTVIEDLQKTEKLSSFELPEIHVERPKDDQFGEYTSNVALVLAKLTKKNPLEVAEAISQQLTVSNQQEKTFEKIEVVKPGHINFYLSQKILTSSVTQVLREGQKFGANDRGKSVKVNNEFISANPTGPLSVGNGRGGFYADVVAGVLRKSGYLVTNEYYINDAGEQVLKLGHSVLQDDKAVYGGDYIDVLHEKVGEKSDVREVGEWAAKIVLEDMIKKTVKEKMHIHFDIWTSEKKIIADGFVERALKILEERKQTFEKDGAIWMRTTEWGDDKDRVLVKQDGTKTYLASDAGHILSYIESGVDIILETFGADHHGYTKRFEAVARSLGFTGKIHFTLVQLVKVVKDGKEVRMSKRAGNVVTIDELIEKVGHDVARFFFLMYAPETHMNFDLGLAEERSQKNPVFYVQYAHARLCSVLRKADDEGFGSTDSDLSLLVHPKERELIRELLFFPELIETVAKDFSVHKLPQYAIRLADKLHSFYDACRVLDAENKLLSEARLELIRAVKIVLAETLHLMGISAPEKM
jgi:arginyl-tRNA synthetase